MADTASTVSTIPDSAALPAGQAHQVMLWPATAVIVFNIVLLAAWLLTRNRPARSSPQDNPDA